MPRRHCVVAGWSYSCLTISQICKDANRQRLIDVKLTTAKRRGMHRMATIECPRSLGVLEMPRRVRSRPLYFLALLLCGGLSQVVSRANTITLARMAVLRGHHISKAF